MSDPAVEGQRERIQRADFEDSGRSAQAGSMSESTGIPQGSPAVGAAGSAPAAPGVGGTECSGAAVGSARIAVKKAQLRSSPRPKKLEKLGVYSSCKVSFNGQNIVNVYGAE